MEELSPVLGYALTVQSALMDLVTHITRCAPSYHPQMEPWVVSQLSAKSNLTLIHCIDLCQQVA